MHAIARREAGTQRKNCYIESLRHCVSARVFMTIRPFLLVVGFCLALTCGRSTSVLAAEQSAASRHGPMRVTEVETHEINVPYVDWLAYPLNHYYGPTKRVVYVVHTDNGLIGLGER